MKSNGLEKISQLMVGSKEEINSKLIVGAKTDA
jgi:hypothetical protein